MDLREILLLFESELKKDFFNSNSNEFWTKYLSEINSIGIPNLVLDKFIPYQQEIVDDVLVFSKSKISDIFLGINLNTGHVVCFSDYNPIQSFVNTDYVSFIKTNSVYEIFRRVCLITQSLGAYYDKTEKGGNYEKYANLLRELINGVDEKAANEGVWHSLILEMSMGVI